MSSSRPMVYSFCLNCHSLSPKCCSHCLSHRSCSGSLLYFQHSAALYNNVYWCRYRLISGFVLVWPACVQKPTSSLLWSHLCCWAESFLSDSYSVANSQQFQLHQWAKILIDTNLAVQKGKIDGSNKGVSSSQPSKWTCSGWMEMDAWDCLG